MGNSECRCAPNFDELSKLELAASASMDLIPFAALLVAINGLARPAHGHPKRYLFTLDFFGVGLAFAFTTFFFGVALL